MARQSYSNKQQRNSRFKWLFGIGTATLLSGLLLAGHGPSDSRVGAESLPAAKPEVLPEKFDHDSTSFPLRGGHRILKCEQCHLAGQYKTLPTRCDECHTGQFVYGKPNNHILTSQNCNVCHTESDWTFYHNLIGGGQQCSTCHNGQVATGKPPGHIPTTAECNICHNTRAWEPTTFKHDTGTKLIGGHAGLSCTACHVASTFAVIYRDGTTYGFCANCHTRDYKPADGHTSISVDANCARCHRHAGYTFGG